MWHQKSRCPLISKPNRFDPWQHIPDCKIIGARSKVDHGIPDISATVDMREEGVATVPRCQEVGSGTAIENVVAGSCPQGVITTARTDKHVVRQSDYIEVVRGYLDILVRYAGHRAVISCPVD